MDALLAIASKREVREYSDKPVPDDVRRRILEAGRVAGSAANRQPWRFLVLEDVGLRERVAETVFEPGNVLGARFTVAVVVSGKGPLAFDSGRAAQNMMLAAWNEGVGSSPNGMPDPDATAELLDVREGERPVMILTFGYPARPRDPEARSVEEWLGKAKRKPLEELVETR
ncbi:MAG: nitroreductase family protein [Gaiellaceae bacterium]